MRMFQLESKAREIERAQRMLRDLEAIKALRFQLDSSAPLRVQVVLEPAEAGRAAASDLHPEIVRALNADASMVLVAVRERLRALIAEGAEELQAASAELAAEIGRVPSTPRPTAGEKTPAPDGAAQ